VKLCNLYKIIISIFVTIIYFSGCTNNNNIQIWIATPWQQVLQNTPPCDLEEVGLRSAANEYEPFRIIIHNGGNSLLEDIHITVNNLKGKKGNIITADNINLFRAHYFHVTEPSHRTQNPVGWYPDALIPFSSQMVDKEMENVDYMAAPFSVNAGHNAEVWCDLFVPEGTHPGEYRGTVTVKAGNKKLANVHVCVNVWDFKLPEKITMVSQFGNLHVNSMKMIGLEEGTREFEMIEDLYNKELLKHRAVPRAPVNVWPEWNERDGLIEGGETERMRKLVEDYHVNSLNIPWRYKDEPEKCKAYLIAIAKWLRKLGYLDIAYINLEDEPNDAEEYDIARREGALVESADPDILRRVTEQTIPTNPEWGDLYGAVDIWCPLWGNYNEFSAKERQSKGEQMRSYTALNQGPAGTPWWQIDMDPLNFRSPFWLSWRHNLTGFHYWSSTCWSPYETEKGAWEKPHFRDRYWGEGMLLYPGQPVGIKGFVPSIRLKLYREAMEDYEYMVMAAKEGNKNKVDSIVNNIVKDFQNWSHVREDYEEARIQLAEIIIKSN